jgi:pseudouridine-5'-phosphate glycosidase
VSTPSTIAGGFSAALRVAPAVAAALTDGRAVVALESTVIAHGLPYPANVEVARAMEAAIRAEGAEPATVAILDGHIHVGLDDADIERLGTATGVLKASRRDIAPALARGAMAATTVAGTLACAALAGVRFFATGGIGGVHRGAPTTFDISADLPELARAPVVTVCAGAKLILDLPLTLEYLETQGVPVLGYQTDELPAFYVRESGLPLTQRADDPQQVAATAHTLWSTGVGAGMVVACPIPAEHALARGPIEAAITAALAAAHEAGVRGAAVTPFLLAYLAHATQGESVAANRALLLNNATLAARFAVAFAALTAAGR